jgi:eukaryotic-like serine/threonine-protein kinase
MLQANVLVRGSVQQEGEQVRVTFFVDNAEERSQLLADGITGPVSDLFAMQDQVAEKVAGSLGLPQPPPSESAGLTTAAQLNGYLKALGLLQRYEKKASVESAIQTLESLERQDTPSAAVQAALGRAYLHMYDLTKERAWADKAMQACERAKAAGGGLADVHVTMGELLNKTGKPEEAAAEFQAALALQPEFALAIIGLGDAHRAAKRFPEAEKSYRQAIALQPGYWSPYNKLGALYFNNARYADAEEMFRKVIQLTPDNARVYMNLGAVYLYLERLDESRAALESSIRLDPTGFAYTNLGTLEFFAGNYPASARNFEKSVEMTPKDYLLWANLGDAYRWTPGSEARAKKAFARAITLGKERIAVNPNDSKVQADLAALYAKVGETAQASRQIARALQLDSKSPHNMYKAAVVAAVAGRKKETLDWIARALAAGYSRSQIQRDPEFGALRGEAAFREALGKPHPG